MNTARWFLAHSKQDKDSDIDGWCLQLKDKMCNEQWDTEVTAGRDDYKARAAAIGGWSAWCRDVASGKSYTGDHLFHGIIVPIDSTQESTAVGKATALMVKGFIDAQKQAYVWCPTTETFKAITGLNSTEIDDWSSWVRLSHEE